MSEPADEYDLGMAAAEAMFRAIRAYIDAGATPQDFERDASRIWPVASRDAAVDLVAGALAAAREGVE